MDATATRPIPALPWKRIAELCQRYSVAELSVFGSYLTGELRPDSDLDFLVVFRDDDAGPWAAKLQDLERELSELLGRRVDLISKRGIEQSSNWIVRERILGSARVVYGS